MPLLSCPDCGHRVSDLAPACPSCGRPRNTQQRHAAAYNGHQVAEMSQPYPPPTAAQPPVEAYLVRRKEFLGVGCVVQGLGLLLPVGGFFVRGLTGAGIGFLLALPFLLWGGRLAMPWACGACGTKVKDRNVTVCSTCGAHIVVC